MDLLCSYFIWIISNGETLCALYWRHNTIYTMGDWKLSRKYQHNPQQLHDFFIRPQVGRENVRFLGVHLDAELRSDIYNQSTKKNEESHIWLYHSIMSFAILVWWHSPKWLRVFFLQRLWEKLVNWCTQMSNKFKGPKIYTMPSLNILYVTVLRQLYWIQKYI